MKYRTVTERIGEKVGEIDWSYDFRSHFNNHCTSDAGRQEHCDKSVQRLRKIDEAIKQNRRIFTTTYGGWPRIAMHEVTDIGMYDGWPYWKPVPSVQVRGVLGPEWHSFSSLTDIEET